ncbi:hypothetical protein BD779DRAFT_1597695 [Infundibulicybe gibba]|nr:hypothetical protein BD779DRAFT_1597695 [Infundibulicybe gibba]
MEICTHVQILTPPTHSVQLVHRRTTRRQTTNVSTRKNVCEARCNTCSSPTPTTLVFHHAPTPFRSRVQSLPLPTSHPRPHLCFCLLPINCASLACTPPLLCVL